MPPSNVRFQQLKYAFLIFLAKSLLEILIYIFQSDYKDLVLLMDELNTFKTYMLKKLFILLSNLPIFPR